MVSGGGGNDFGGGGMLFLFELIVVSTLTNGPFHRDNWKLSNVLIIMIIVTWDRRRSRRFNW